MLAVVDESNNVLGFAYNDRTANYQEIDNAIAYNKYIQKGELLNQSGIHAVREYAGRILNHSKEGNGRFIKCVGGAERGMGLVV